jgi:hypothetical protein
MKTQIKIILTLLVLLSINVHGQFDYAKPQTLYAADSFAVKFFFYSEGDGIQNNGVSMILINENPYPLDYSFDLIFRADSLDKTVTLQGEIDAEQIKTGSTAGLYFLPFQEPPRAVSHVGITKIRISRKSSSND